MTYCPAVAAVRPGPSRREYTAVLLPFILSTVTQPLIGAVDTAVMGRLSDPAYIAGVAVGAVIFNTLYWLLGFLRVVSTGFSAQALAAGDTAAGWKAFVLPAIMALALGGLILMCQEPIFAGAMLLLRLDPSARDVAAVYYGILVWAAPLTLLNYVILGWLMGQARIKASLLMQVGGNVVNMVLDLLFVSLFGWGVAGVAAASVLSCLFSTATGAAAMRTALPPLPLPLLRLVSLAGMLRMARVNGHLFLRTVCLLIQTNTFMATTAAFGTLTLSANAVILQIMLIFSYVFEGIANTSSVFAGRAAGQGSPDMLERTRRHTLCWSLATVLLMTAVYGLWHMSLLRLFTNLPDVLATAAHYAAWGIGFPACAALGLTYYGLFTGASLTRPVFLSTLQALAAFALAWLALVPFWGNHGLWTAYLIFYAGRTLFLLRYWPRLRGAPFFNASRTASCCPPALQG